MTDQSLPILTDYASAINQAITPVESPDGVTCQADSKDVVFAGSLVFQIADQAVTSTIIIAKETGNEHASVIKLVRTYLVDFEEFGLVRFEIEPRSDGQHGGGDREIALLNEHQATLLMTYMRNNDVVRAFKKRLVRAFYEFAKRALPQDYLSALKALVVSEEAKLVVEAKNRALEQQIETDKPYAELARAITGQSTMTRREWCSLMKNDHGTNIKERDLTAWLIDNKYCYRDQLDRTLRVYAHHANLFKFEYEVINGVPRPMLKVTGDGIFRLTPVVIQSFSPTTA
jgi:phage regulator Rha-like protein